MDITYTFNSVNFNTHGVYVSGSNGMLGLPPKKIEIFEYPGESGNVPDLVHAHFDVRTIELSCFIKADSAGALTAKFNAFVGIFEQTSTKSLTATIGSGSNAKTLSFLVYLKSVSVLKKTFCDGLNVGTFTLTFIEPDTSIYEANNS